jgi:hypothetical protein
MASGLRRPIEESRRGITPGSPSFAEGRRGRDRANSKPNKLLPGRTIFRAPPGAARYDRMPRASSYGKFPRLRCQVCILMAIALSAVWQGEGIEPADLGAVCFVCRLAA